MLLLHWDSAEYRRESCTDQQLCPPVHNAAPGPWSKAEALLAQRLWWRRLGGQRLSDHDGRNAATAAIATTAVAAITAMTTASAMATPATVATVATAGGVATATGAGAAVDEQQLRIAQELRGVRAKELQLCALMSLYIVLFVVHDLPSCIAEQ